MCLNWWNDKGQSFNLKHYFTGEGNDKEYYCSYLQKIIIILKLLISVI